MISPSSGNTTSVYRSLQSTSLPGTALRNDTWVLVSGVINAEQVSQIAHQVALDYNLQMACEYDTNHICLISPEESANRGVVEIHWRQRLVSPPNTLSYQICNDDGLEVLITYKGALMEESAIVMGTLLEGHVRPYSVPELDSIITSMPLVLQYSTLDPALANWALIFRDHYVENSVGFVLGMERARHPS